MLYSWGMEDPGRIGIGEALARRRAARMWTQRDLAREAGVSPTTVSGVESGRISAPHFGTIRKLATALGVDAEDLVRGRSGPQAAGSGLSLRWSDSADEDDFEDRLDSASLRELNALSRELDGERVRLQRLYGESPSGSSERRAIKARIRDVAARAGSVTTSAMFHRAEDDWSGDASR